MSITLISQKCGWLRVTLCCLSVQCFWAAYLLTDSEYFPHFYKCAESQEKIKMPEVVIKKKSLLTGFDCHQASEEAFHGLLFSLIKITLLKKTKQNKHHLRSFFIFPFLSKASHRKNKNKTWTWLTCSYLKPPPDGSFIICATEGAPQEDFITSAYTRQVCTHLKSLLEIIELHSHSRKIHEQQRPLLLKSCTNSKSMLGFDPLPPKYLTPSGSAAGGEWQASVTVQFLLCLFCGIYFFSMWR